MLNGHLEVDHTRPEMVKEVPSLLFVFVDMDFPYFRPEMKFVIAVTAGVSVKFFARGVNFSGNNKIYNINESKKYISS